MPDSLNAEREEFTIQGTEQFSEQLAQQVIQLQSQQSENQATVVRNSLELLAEGQQQQTQMLEEMQQQLSQATQRLSEVKVADNFNNAWVWSLG